jgi:hypothetical protein
MIKYEDDKLLSGVSTETVFINIIEDCKNTDDVAQKIITSLIKLVDKKVYIRIFK